MIDGHVGVEELVEIKIKAEAIERDAAERVEAINTEMTERAAALEKRLQEMVAGIGLNWTPFVGPRDVGFKV